MPAREPFCFFTSHEKATSDTLSSSHYHRHRRTFLEQVVAVHAMQNAMERPSVFVVGDPASVVALSGCVIQSLERNPDTTEDGLDQAGTVQCVYTYVLDRH